MPSKHGSLCIGRTEEDGGSVDGVVEGEGGCDDDGDDPAGRNDRPTVRRVRDESTDARATCSSQHGCRIRLRYADSAWPITGRR